MDNDKIKEIPKNKKTVHHILFHSYSLYLFVVIIGFLLDVLFPLEVFSSKLYQYIGLILIILGPIVIYWAQNTSASYNEEEAKLKNKTYFNRGPYRFLRSPTHFGLFILTLGFSLIINSLFSILLIIVAHFSTKIFFINRQEKILEDKYGDDYLDYKRKVKDWI